MGPWAYPHARVVDPEVAEVLDQSPMAAGVGRTEYLGQGELTPFAEERRDDELRAT
jgi:hypothetical protein